MFYQVGVGADGPTGFVPRHEPIDEDEDFFQDEIRLRMRLR